MTWSRPSSSSRRHADDLLGPVLRASALSSALLLALIAGFLVVEAWPAVASGGWRRFFAEGWFPGSDEFNLWPMLAATLAVTLCALVLAVPMGVLGAVFARYLAPVWVAQPWRALVALLAGIPSVVFGLWGLTALVPLISAWEPPGTSLLAATLVLALMILPTILLAADSALAAVPGELRRGAAALGLARHAIIIRVLLPAARAGIAGGVLLAAARALGETMAVLMVAGNIVQVPTSLFDSVRVLTANMALEMAYATGDHRAALFVSGMLLTVLVAVLVRFAGGAGQVRHA